MRKVKVNGIFETCHVLIDRTLTMPHNSVMQVSADTLRRMRLSLGLILCVVFMPN